MRTVLLVLFLAYPTLAVAQTPATYADRAAFAANSAFHGRVLIASLAQAIVVINEPPDTAQYAQRVRLAGQVLRDPEFVSRRLTVLLAATIPVTVDLDGVATTALTDTQLQASIAANWTKIAVALLGG